MTLPWPLSSSDRVLLNCIFSHYYSEILILVATEMGHFTNTSMLEFLRALLKLLRNASNDIECP